MMSKPIQISIISPCTQKREVLAHPGDDFCSHCQKTVIDFTQWNDADLYEFAIKNWNNSICGRFKAGQLNRSISLPHQPLSRLYNLFLGLGLTLIFAQVPTQQTFAKAPMAFVYNNEYTNNANTEESNVKETMIIKGVVLDRDKKPIIGAIIRVIRGDIPLYVEKIESGTITGVDGSFSFTMNESRANLGRYIMYVEHPSHTAQIVSMRNFHSSKDIAFELEGLKEGGIMFSYFYPLVKTHPGFTRSVSEVQVEKTPH